MNTNRRRGRETYSLRVPSCLSFKEIKGIKALDRHERHSLCNLLSIHSQQHQQRKTRLLSLGNPGKHPRQFFQQANTLGSPNHLHRETTCLSACCVLSFKSLNDPQVPFLFFSRDKVLKHLSDLDPVNQLLFFMYSAIIF